MKVENAPSLPGLSPVVGKPIIARVDGGQVSLGDVMPTLREVEARFGIADRLAA